MATSVLDPRHPTPLWAQLAATLRDRLSTGAYVERFPTESELASEFDVSRATVREAVRRLRAEGLLDARRGSGTFVVRRELDEPVLGTPELARAIIGAGLEEESVVRHFAEGPAGAEGAAALRIGAGTTVVWIERLRVSRAAVRRSAPSSAQRRTAVFSSSRAARACSRSSGLPLPARPGWSGAGASCGGAPTS